MLCQPKLRKSILLPLNRESTKKFPCRRNLFLMESEQQQNNIIKCPQSICFDKTTCVTTKLIVKDYPTECLLLNLQLGTCSFVFVDKMTDHNRQCISSSPTKKRAFCTRQRMVLFVVSRRNCNKNVLCKFCK